MYIVLNPQTLFMKLKTLQLTNKSKVHLEFVSWCTWTPYLYVKLSVLHVLPSNALKPNLFEWTPNHMKIEPILAYNLKNLAGVMFVQMLNFDTGK